MKGDVRDTSQSSLQTVSPCMSLKCGSSNRVRVFEFSVPTSHEFTNRVAKHVPRKVSNRSFQRHSTNRSREGSPQKYSVRSSFAPSFQIAFPSRFATKVITERERGSPLPGQTVQESSLPPSLLSASADIKHVRISLLIRFHGESFIRRGIHG